MSALYVPGTSEKDPAKTIMALQNVAATATTNTTNIATNTAAIATINTTLAAGLVNSIAGNNGAFTLNATSGVTNTANDIKLSQATSSQFGAVKVDGTTITAASGVISTINPLPAPITASLGADVLLNNTANYFDGPSIAQGSTGTWFASGTVTIVDTAASSIFSLRLWDGTNIIASAKTTSVSANNPIMVSLSGYKASPAGNLRISVKDTLATTGKILFNASGDSKDSTISAYRIA